ncbi:hypothetical protein SAY87_019638 [Trapa incisa]|uniref:Uncharacterized protein n=1 Tax=Trapa incisa TaxID=236973 RepID=A0AAN7K2Q2_9MYRT|nr:hypothetical protein SAY87_019638 [Trapa incisa]
MSAYKVLKVAVFFACFLQLSLASRLLSEAVQDQAQPLQYHKGPLLTGKISVNLIWYGKFKASQRSIISDFVASLSSSSAGGPMGQGKPSVAAWWKHIEKYYHLSGSKKASLSLSLGTQLLDESYSLGKSLTDKKVTELASRGQQKDAVNVVLTASDVTVDGFCMNRCGSHGSALGTARARRGLSKFAYVWVGDSTSQCPGQCAWPFHQPIYGPQSSPLVAPNNDRKLPLLNQSFLPHNDTDVHEEDDTREPSLMCMRKMTGQNVTEVHWRVWSPRPSLLHHQWIPGALMDLLFVLDHGSSLFMELLSGFRNAKPDHPVPKVSLYSI